MQFGKRPGLFLHNSRFYILIITFLLSMIILTFSRTSIDSTTLFMIRVQQVYGFMALFYWYLSLLASPLASCFGKDGFMKQYLYARRALGVSAAYFALLHMLFGLFGQLGGPGNLLLLPGRFQQALLFGAVALIFLLVMAATSFDKVIRLMTFPRWKWLHRLGYIAAILVFLHVWMIGTHISYPWVRWTFFSLLTVLAIAESFRAARALRKRLGGTNQLIFIFFFITFLGWSIGVITYLPRLVAGYHESHSVQAGGH
jgi:sulfoxide reductase heme-binding subunit YedZ